MYKSMDLQMSAQIYHRYAAHWILGLKSLPPLLYVVWIPLSGNVVMVALLTFLYLEFSFLVGYPRQYITVTNIATWLSVLLFIHCVAKIRSINSVSSFSSTRTWLWLPKMATRHRLILQVDHVFWWKREEIFSREDRCRYETSFRSTAISFRESYWLCQRSRDVFIFMSIRRVRIVKHSKKTVNSSGLLRARSSLLRIQRNVLIDDPLTTVWCKKLTD